MMYNNGDIVKLDDLYGRIVDIEEDKYWFVYRVIVLRNDSHPKAVGMENWLDMGLVNRHGRKLNKLEMLVLLGLEEDKEQDG